MYVDLIQTIKTTLETVKAIKTVKPYPLSQGEKIEKYPAVIFYPDSSTNEFETVADNKKEYRFKLYVIVDLSGQATLENVFTKILPNAVDQVIEAFDKAWHLQVTGASQSWQLIDSGNWAIYPTDKPTEAIAELNLKVRLLTSTQ